MASRVRPEVETGNRRPTLHAHRVPGGQVEEKGEAAQALHRDRLCLGTKGSPSPAVIVLLQRELGREPSGRKNREETPDAPSHPFLEVGSVNDPEIYQRKGSAQRHTTAPHPPK